MTRRILVILAALGFLNCLIGMAVHFSHPASWLHNWPEDPNIVVTYIIRTFVTFLVLLSVVPYLIASILMDALRPRWKVLSVMSIGLYVAAMLPFIEGGGIYSGMASWTGPLFLAPFFGFPLLLTGKFIWFLLGPRIPDGTAICAVCGHNLHRLSSSTCPECGKPLPSSSLSTAERPA